MKKPIKVILFLFFLSTYLQLFSQFVTTQQYSFINYKENKIEFFGNSEKQFHPFFEKMKQTIALGSTQIRVLHIGDKQIRDDIFTAQVYYNLSSTLSGLENRRGMLWEVVNSLNSKEDIEIEIADYDKNSDLLCNKFRLYHSPLNDSINIFINDLGSSYKRIYFADKGYTLFELKKPISKVNLSVVNNSSKHFFIYGYYLESDNAGFIYDIIARNNTSINQYLLDDILHKQLETMNVDMVVISLGANEAYSPAYFSESFKLNIQELISKLRSIKPNIPIIITTPFDSYVTNKPNPRLTKATEDLIEVAQSTNCALWNFYKIMGAKGSSEDWSRKNLMDNRKIVLTQKGSMFQGDLFYNAFWQSFENYLSN